MAWKCATASYESYLRKVMSQCDRVPIDVIRPLISSLLEDGEDLQEQSCCTKCCTPWKAGLSRFRLLKRPKMSRLIKVLLRKQRKNVKRLKNSEKLRLSLYRTQRNTLEIVCLVCKEKFKVYCSLPEDMKKSLPVRETRKTIDKTLNVSMLTDKKKKKKKRVKELNAGLLISLPSSEHHTKLKKRKHQEELAGGKPPGITEISSQRENLRNGISGESKGNSNIGETYLKKDVVERIVDTVPVEKVSNVPSGLLVSEKFKTRRKERDFLNKTIKLKMENDAARVLKNKTALGDFLSSLI
ncbi:uncharacterized protein LOC135216870 [Macrobrachium nipponense]|uniref:uncharacterized protein LOC135216870 n=1 Tax=Macrobrachium nipponense TaxID=159736 RepID=UPI0030C8A227